MLVAAVMGLAWESILVLSGLVSYSSGNLVPGIAPYWIVAMWVLFATTINHGLRWIKRDWRVAAIAGLVGGPLAFLGGAGMGAVWDSGIVFIFPFSLSVDWRASSDFAITAAGGRGTLSWRAASQAMRAWNFGLPLIRMA